jgi:hypothetical protein
LDMNILITILSKLHEKIKYTVERGKIEGDTQSINFLDIKVVLHNNETIETEIYYKTTNNHHYLEYNSFHPKHIKDNIPYNLAKRIIIFTSDSAKEKIELERLKCWLKRCNYPDKVIEKKIRNAKLQGPAPNPLLKKEVIPFITTYSNNYSNKAIVQHTNTLLNNCPDAETKKCFENKRIIEALRQPKNIQRELTSARYDRITAAPKPRGIYHCKDKRCDICRLYLIECNSFITANGDKWEIPTHITCQSKNVIYFQVCTGCNIESNVGKTNNLRLRTNNHISSCRNGNSTDRFDNHVHYCQKCEPYFKLTVFLEVNDARKLITYETSFHLKGYDTINRNRAKTY